jgi:hypothetical protein
MATADKIILDSSLEVVFWMMIEWVMFTLPIHNNISDFLTIVDLQPEIGKSLMRDERIELFVDFKSANDILANTFIRTANNENVVPGLYMAAQVGTTLPHGRDSSENRIIKAHTDPWV